MSAGCQPTCRLANRTSGTFRSRVRTRALVRLAIRDAVSSAIPMSDEGADDISARVVLIGDILVNRFAATTSSHVVPGVVPHGSPFRWIFCDLRVNGIREGRQLARDTPVMANTGIVTFAGDN